MWIRRLSHNNQYAPVVPSIRVIPAGTLVLQTDMSTYRIKQTFEFALVHAWPCQAPRAGSLTQHAALNVMSCREKQPTGLEQPAARQYNLYGPIVERIHTLYSARLGRPKLAPFLLNAVLLRHSSHEKEFCSSSTELQ